MTHRSPSFGECVGIVLMGMVGIAIICLVLFVQFVGAHILYVLPGVGFGVSLVLVYKLAKRAPELTERLFDSKREAELAYDKWQDRRRYRAELRAFDAALMKLTNGNGELLPQRDIDKIRSLLEFKRDTWWIVNSTVIGDDGLTLKDAVQAVGGGDKAPTDLKMLREAVEFAQA